MLEKMLEKLGTGAIWARPMSVWNNPPAVEISATAFDRPAGGPLPAAAIPVTMRAGVHRDRAGRSRSARHRHPAGWRQATLWLPRSWRRGRPWLHGWQIGGTPRRKRRSDPAPP